MCIVVLIYKCKYSNMSVPHIDLGRECLRDRGALHRSDEHTFLSYHHPLRVCRVDVLGRAWAIKYYTAMARPCYTRLLDILRRDAICEYMHLHWYTLFANTNIPSYGNTVARPDNHIDTQLSDHACDASVFSQMRIIPTCRNDSMCVML